MERVFIARISFEKNDVGLSPLKIEAGLNLAAKLSNKFELIPSFEIDSLLNFLNSQGINPTVDEICKELNCDKTLTVEIKRLANILRVKVSAYNLKDRTTRNAIGYGVIHYFRKDNEEPILDPALLQAFQRAFAIIYQDSAMYSNLEGSLRIKPAPTLAIGSINYVDDDTLSNWDLFQKRQTTSFFGIETIYEIARTSPDFIVYDIETRDSAYAILNLYEPENFAPVSPLEVKALQFFEIEYFIYGEFFRSDGLSKIRLYLTKVAYDGLIIVRQEESVIEKDNIDDFRNVLQRLTRKILSM
ncbi:MAG: hypothetical protein ACUVQ1_00745 [Candidatus Kapaibacteriales bacterium]